MVGMSAGQTSGEVADQAQAAIEKVNGELVKAWAKDVPALDKRLDLVIRNKSLPEALDAVAKEAGVSVRLIPGSLEDAAEITGRKDVRVTYLDLKRATVAQALDWILVPARMAWWVDARKGVVAGTVRRGNLEAPWVYDVALLALPSAKELAALKQYDQRVAAAKKDADAFMKAVRGALGAREDACLWYAPGQVLLYANADVHAAAVKLLADLADPKEKLEGALADLQKTTSKRAESRKEPAAKLAAARQVAGVARTLHDQSWKLLAAAAEGKLDLEALTELQAAWASPEAAEILKGKAAGAALRSLWAVTETARALPKEKEAADLAKAARRLSEPAARAAVAALEKSPEDAGAFAQALYAALALKDDAELTARAKPLLTMTKDAKSPLGPARTMAAALLAPASQIDAKALVALTTSDLRGEDTVVLAALACRRAGGDAWTAFRAESRRILGEQPLPGSVVILVNNLARPNLALASAAAGK
jgi:hypothetical protein